MSTDPSIQTTTNAAKPKRRLTRRFWMRSALGCIASGIGLSAWTVFVEPWWIAVTRFALKLPNLPAQWHGRKLVHISDFHIGQVPVEFLTAAMHTVNSLEPDLLAITGDFIDHTGGIDQGLDEVLSSLSPAKIATFGCLGNHDYGRRWAQPDVADAVVEVADKYGIRVLRDERVDLDGLNVMGIDDFWSPRCNPQNLLLRTDANVASLCLCHNPDVCDMHDWSSFQGVVLAGHTHGGQCKPPFLPPPILPVKNRRYTSGLFDLNPGRQLFITRGLGHTTQVRFNCRPEIAVIDLQPA